MTRLHCPHCCGWSARPSSDAFAAFRAGGLIGQATRMQQLVVLVEDGWGDLSLWQCTRLIGVRPARGLLQEVDGSELVEDPAV